MSHDWLRSLPKVELHLHLEGAMPAAVLRRLALKYGRSVNVPEKPPAPAVQPYRDFAEFDRAWSLKNTLIREAEDFRAIAAGAGARLREDGVVYAEMSFCPSDFPGRGLSEPELIDAVRHGIDEVPEVEIALIVDLNRVMGPVHADRQMRIAAELKRSHGVIGIGMGGYADAHEPEAFAGIYAAARRLGLRTTVHAGEVEGPEQMLRTLCALEPDRVGHGTSAAASPTAMSILARDKVQLEVCPSSNVYTGVVPTLAHHPARRFYESGIPISLNTDDPVMFGTSLSAEYNLAQTDLGFSSQDLLVLMKTAIEMSWMTAESKACRLSEIARAVAALPPDAGRG